MPMTNVDASILGIELTKISAPSVPGTFAEHYCGWSAQQAPNRAQKEGNNH